MHENKKIWVNNYNLSAHPDLAGRQINLDILRIDTIHPVISGNKWFKLQGWLEQARRQNAKQLLTFGGAWSNHIVATACSAAENQIPAIGIIRGEKPATPSQTLLDARSYGMELRYISREEYNRKSDPVWLDELSQSNPHACMIPEGGAGLPGIRGCEEILRVKDTTSYTHIICAYGTGTMLQGLLDAAAPGQTVLGVSVLKGHPATPCPHVIGEYHFGGYARHTPDLIAFMNEFYSHSGIPTDFVYTGKTCFAVFDMIRKDFFPPGSRLLIIHSGGLQGNRSLHRGVLYF